MTSFFLFFIFRGIISFLNFPDEIALLDALKNANKFQEKYYPSVISTKKILLLQNKGKGEFWNITFITNSLEVLHFNIDCNNGELLMHEKSSLLQFRSN